MIVAIAFVYNARQGRRLEVMLDPCAATGLARASGLSMRLNSLKERSCKRRW